jgi:hypothetical protein
LAIKYHQHIRDLSHPDSTLAHIRTDRRNGNVMSRRKLLVGAYRARAMRQSNKKTVITAALLGKSAKHIDPYTPDTSGE